MRFEKYHGAGNDFVMIEDLDARLGAAGELPADLVGALCDRHTGVGADGVIRVLPGESVGAFRMDYYNADGGEAEMCGNGIRCLIDLERRAGRLDDGDHKIETKTRVVTVRTTGTHRYTVDMGEPAIRPQSVTIDDQALDGMNVSMGNPHFVLFVPDASDELVLGLGPRLERHPDFPDRTNVEFAVIEGATKIRLRVWERGVGETLACGSGTCAAVVAAAALERTGPHVLVDVPGGELEVEWDAPGHVWLTGEAEAVFSGEIDAGWLERRGLDRHVALVR
jgi:diaminopimelate epimerase